MAAIGIEEKYVKILGNVRFYIAQYPVRQRDLHFDFVGKHSSHAAITCDDIHSHFHCCLYPGSRLYR